ncbi:MAG TPA: C1 family peptidase [Candidatus Limnocylindrales bacterium]|nr:C1 family peptidase [Candidatus Limnocylindrales bacterium]
MPFSTHESAPRQVVAGITGHHVMFAWIREYAMRYPWNREPRLRRPAAVDLSGWIPGRVIDQGLVPLCTAAVTTTLAQYWAARAGITFIPSVLFNYRLSRRLSGRPDRHGSMLEHSFEAWRRYGLVPEDRWPFQAERVDVDPPIELLESAHSRDVVYGRLDGPHLAPPAYLDQLRTCLAWGIPLSVEFPLGPSVMSSFTSGVVAVPPPGEHNVGRHVVVVLGYDDRLAALRLRNDWGTGWGESGYGWLPYEMLLRSIARHTWLILESPWEPVN